MNPSDTGRNQSNPQSKSSDSLDPNGPGQARSPEPGMSQGNSQGSQQSGLSQGSRQDSLGQQDEWALDQGLQPGNINREGGPQSNQSGLGQQSVNQGAAGQTGPLGRDDLDPEQGMGRNSRGLQREGQQKSSGSGNQQSGSARPGTVKPSDLSAAEWRESNNQHRYGDGQQGGFESVDLDQVSDIVNRRPD
jgi:hypothetical protein